MKIFFIGSVKKRCLTHLINSKFDLIGVYTKKKLIQIMLTLQLCAKQIIFPANMSSILIAMKVLNGLKYLNQILYFVSDGQDY